MVEYDVWGKIMNYFSGIWRDITTPSLIRADKMTADVYVPSPDNIEKAIRNGTVRELLRETDEYYARNECYGYD